MESKREWMESAEEEDRHVREEFEAWRAEIGREDEMFLAAMQEDGRGGEEKDPHAGAVLISDAEKNDAKERGNKFFAMGKFAKAVEWYDIAERRVEGADRAVVLANRSLAKLRLGNAVGAAVDAQVVLSTRGVEEKIQMKAKKRLEAARSILHAESFELLRERGNTAFKSGRYLEAIELYTASSETACSAEESALSYSNRSLVNLKLKRYAEAEHDAKAALRCELPSKIRTKTEQRLEKAQEELRRGRDVRSSSPKHVSPIDDAGKISIIEMETTTTDIAASSSTSRRAPREPVLAPIVSTLEIAVEVPQNPPTTFYEFEKEWRNLRKYPSIRLSYLETIDTDKYYELFGDCLSAELLEDLSNLFLSHVPNPMWVISALTSFTKVRRFDMVLMLSAEITKQRLQTVLERASESLRADDSAQYQIRNLRAMYS